MDEGVLRKVEEKVRATISPLIRETRVNPFESHRELLITWSLSHEPSAEELDRMGWPITSILGGSVRWNVSPSRVIVGYEP